MLLELNVKDIALVKKASVEFGEGINILTGETGTGKSVIIDSALLALGAKAKADIIRRGAEYAYAELVFDTDEELKARLHETGIDADENGLIVISRKIMPGKSISRINDETVTVARLKNAAALLLDVYGQNEYYTLKDSRQHLVILDEYMGAEIAELKNNTAAAFTAYREAERTASEFSLDEQERARRIDLLSFELNEINEAALKDGEEEELAADVRRMSNARSILELAGSAGSMLSACDIGQAVSDIERAMRYDEDGLKDIYAELMDAQAVFESAVSDINAYTDSFELDEAALDSAEKRLDLIRRLELKYGQSISDILSYRDQTEAELMRMQDYDRQKAEALAGLKAAEDRLNDCCGKLSAKRRAGAEKLCSALIKELKELGFDKPSLKLSFSQRKANADGYDDIEFMAALNPGEQEKALGEVASGGELSRVMLAIKTVLAETDDMPTLIFDEIDTGISGRTAQKVAEKLDRIGTRHQVICVSHLPQIAAMADTHFVIKKTETDGRNITNIQKLDEQGSLEELARLLGGESITRAVMDNASELKENAKLGKIKRRQN